MDERFENCVNVSSGLRFSVRFEKSKHPGLDDLHQNGGGTRTIALRPGSPAIGHADPNTAPGRDQRGVKRHDPDIGAFERR